VGGDEAASESSIISREKHQPKEGTRRLPYCSRWQTGYWVSQAIYVTAKLGIATY